MLAFVTSLAGCDKRAAEVAAADDQYDARLDANDGEGAVKFVSKDSLARLDRLLTVARTGNSASVKALPYGDKIEVLGMRLLLGRELHQPIDARTYFIRVVNKGWYSSSSSYERIKVKVNGKGTSATVTLRDPEDSETYSSYWVFEDGAWKFDEVADMKKHDAEFRKAVKEAGMTEEEVIFAILEEETGETLTPELWDPPKP